MDRPPYAKARPFDHRCGRWPARDNGRVHTVRRHRVAAHARPECANVVDHAPCARPTRPPSDAQRGGGHGRRLQDRRASPDAARRPSPRLAQAPACCATAPPSRALTATATVHADRAPASVRVSSGACPRLPPHPLVTARRPPAGQARPGRESPGDDASRGHRRRFRDGSPTPGACGPAWPCWMGAPGLPRFGVDPPWGQC